MPPSRDPGGEIRLRLRAIAVAAGIDPGALIEEWLSRAQAAEWAGTPAPESERMALMHIEGRLA